MSDNLDFWRSWIKKDKIPFLVGLALLFMLTIFTFWSWYYGLENVLSWNVLSELQEKIISTPIYSDGSYSFIGTSPLWYIKERYATSLVHVNDTAYYILWIAVLIGFSFFLVGTARLKGTWFLMGALVIGGLLISLRLENVFLAKSNTPFLISFGIIGCFYYLANSYAQHFSSIKTWVLWVSVFAIASFIIYKYSAINQPIMSATAYGLIAFLIISAIFIFIISHELLAGLIWLVSKNATKNKSSLNQLYLIALFYFANLLLIYLENTKQIDKSLLIVHPLVLYVINLLLGVWGFKKLVDQQDWFSYNRSGVWIYLGMAIVSTSTIGFAYATANDSLQELIEDFVAVCQLGVGICFFVWVLINYSQLFKQGLDVQKVLYKSPFSRLLLSRIASVFVVLFLLIFKNYFSFLQLNAGYNNAIADFYLVENDLKTSETFYKNAIKYDPNNHKSNFSLGSLALSLNDKINAAFFFKQAINRNPSPFAYVGLSSSLETENMYFDAVFTLQEGTKIYPESPQILTNLAYLQNKSNVLDSLYLNLEAASKKCSDCAVEKTNLLAFWIENAKIEKLKEKTSEVGMLSNKHYSFEANHAAIDRVLNQSGNTMSFDLPLDSALDMSRAAFLFNRVNNPKNLDKTIDSKTIKSLQYNKSNEVFFEELSLAFAANNYYRDNKTEGLKQMTVMANANSKIKNVYNQTLGLWLLKEGVYKGAIERLNLSGDSASSKILSNPVYEAIYTRNLKLIADQTLKQGITLTNYKDLLNKAPLNPNLLARISDFLTTKNKDLEAYNLMYYAAELNPESPLIWKTYCKKALKLTQFEYAKEALLKLKPLVQAAEYQVAENEYLMKLKNNNASKFE